MDYPLERNLKMAHLLRIKKIAIPRNPVFVGHGFLQNAVAEFIGSHSLRYHI